MAEFPKKITDDPYGAAILVRRLVTEQGIVYWRRYLTAFVLMGISAGATALAAYVFGQVINQADVDKNVHGIVVLSCVTLVLFVIKGASTYGHTVILSKISNAILANNQRRLFAKLMSESVAFFSERHSSEFLARLTAGANSVTQVLNLLINALGRDFLLLIGLVAVMLMQDPYMTLLGFGVAPPAMLVLRKLVKRIKGLAYNQFTGTADILETMQESLQGIRTVKAFTLEETMRARIDESITAVEHNANKMARVSNRSSPLMETLGGFAVAGGLMYGGYSVVALHATPGQFFSFLTAFLMAYEPAKRLARLNIELNSCLVGARMLLEVVDSPASELSDDDKPALKLTDARVELRDVSFAYRVRRGGAQPHEFHRRARQGHRAGRPLRRRQVDGAGLAVALLRGDAGRHPDRRPIDLRGVAAIAAPADRLCRTGRLPVPRLGPRQHRLRQSKRNRRRNRRGREGRLRP